MEVSDLVHRFLGSIGRPKEAEFYLSLFKGDESSTFAVLAVSDSVVREAAGALVADLTFFGHLGLRPVVVLGAGGGAECQHLAAELASRLGDAARLCAKDEALDLHGDSRLAVVSLHGAGDSVAGRFDALIELARALRSRKVVFVGRRSGLQRVNTGAVPSLVSLSEDFDELTQPGILTDAQRVLLVESKRLLGALEHHLTVSITSPLDLLRELFTIKGAGSLIRRGSVVARHRDYAAINRQRLRGLLERAFDKRAAPDLLDRPIDAVFLERDYRGAALITSAPAGAYLSKFAVDADARGEGIGSDLWKAITADYPRLVWRSRPANAITPWYVHVCHGVSKGPEWHVFWRGLDAPEIPGAIDFALGAPVDFVPLPVS